MAGLLDIFGTGGLTELGLLGVSPEEINRYRDDAQAQALYKLAENMFAGGPTGASIAKGLAQGQQAYKEAMRGGMTDLVTQQKLAESVAARNRAAGAQKLLTGALQPKALITSTVGTEYGPDNRDIGGGWSPAGIMSQAPQAMEAKLVQPSLQELIPQFAKYGTEGFDALSKYLDVQKAGKPEYKAVGDYLYEIPMEGAPRQVAGQQKGPSSYQEFQMAATNPEYAKFLRDQEAAKAPKIAVDLKDPTAVAKAQADIVKDWRSVVKDSGAQEVADRLAAAEQAVAEGDAGNKASDGALIYAIGKIYDSSGAVQEGDKKTILGNRSIPDSVKAYAQRALNGQDLLPHERQGLLVMAKKAAKAKAANLQSQMAPYTRISKDLGGTGELLLNPLSKILNEPDDFDVPTGVTVRKR